MMKEHYEMVKVANLGPAEVTRTLDEARQLLA